jgi:glycine/serine hydroxymethyltransferase
LKRLCGTQNITRQGMKEKEMQTIAIYLDKAMHGEDIKEEIIEFVNKYRSTKFSFDS